MINPLMSTDKSFTKYGILKFERLVQLEQMKIGYKLCNDLLPINFTTQIKLNPKCQSNSKQHNYHTRNKQILNLPLVQSSKYRTSFLFCAVREYSSLSVEIRESKTLKTFVYKCKKLLLCE